MLVLWAGITLLRMRSQVWVAVDIFLSVKRYVRRIRCDICDAFAGIHGGLMIKF
jgi:hypothetical protein